MDLSLYQLIEFPDPSYPSFQVEAGGNVRAAVQSDSEHFLRNVAAFGPDQVAVAIRFVFKPAAAGEPLQQRTSIFLAGQAKRDDIAPGLGLLMERGPIHRFFHLRKVKESPIDWKEFHAACDVVRYQCLFEPTVTGELNAHALPAYYSINPFEPSLDNDFLLLDGMLDRVQEPAVVEICVEPANARSELTAHTRYLSLLQQVNRGFDPDDEDSYPRGIGHGGSEWNAALKPLRTREPLIDDILRKQRRFHETLTKPHLRFHIRVFARTPAVARLLASVVAESAFKEGNYRLHDSVRGDPLFDQAVDHRGNLRVIPMDTFHDLRGAETIELFEELSNLSNLAPPDQLFGIFRLPVASHASPRCLRKNTDPPDLDPEELIVLGYDDQYNDDGSASETRGIPRGIRVKNMPKHFFITGMPGSGKTVEGFNVLHQLGHRNFPFIVFEPAKSEYRRLKCLKKHGDPEIRKVGEGLQVYTPGSEISPLRINPFQISDGITRDEHIENLLGCFKASMPMQGSMLGLLGEGLELVYREHPDPENPPCMADLHAAVQRVLASKRYSPEVDSDFRALFDVRLGVLIRRGIGRVFQCRKDIPNMGRLMTGQSIIELACLPPEPACLMTLFILTGIRERIKSTPWSGKGIRLALVLEEAHNIVGRSMDATASEENADPRAHAAEFICRMLAELRSQGVAIIIIDQHPTSVAADVIKNATSKLAFLQEETEDREAIGGSMLFRQAEMEEIARLRPGEAYFHTEGYFGPRKIRTPNLEAEWNLPQAPVGDAVLPFIQDDAWYMEAAEACVESEVLQFNHDLDRFTDSIRRIGAQLKGLIKEWVSILERTPPEKRNNACIGLAKQAKALKDRLESVFSNFQWNVYQRWLEGFPKVGIKVASLNKWRDQLIHRVESVVNPMVSAYREKLESLINQCRQEPHTRKGG